MEVQIAIISLITSILLGVAAILAGVFQKDIRLKLILYFRSMGSDRTSAGTAKGLWAAVVVGLVLVAISLYLVLSGSTQSAPDDSAPVGTAEAPDLANSQGPSINSGLTGQRRPGQNPLEIEQYAGQFAEQRMRTMFDWSTLDRSKPVWYRINQQNASPAFVNVSTITDTAPEVRSFRAILIPNRRSFSFRKVAYLRIHYTLNCSMRVMFANTIEAVNNENRVVISFDDAQIMHDDGTIDREIPDIQFAAWEDLICRGPSPSSEEVFRGATVHDYLVPTVTSAPE